ncbi:MAG TPA: menaquinone biosynthesis protein [Terriglobales bacterium]|nr:menaquinone biosynthesis protein [Terriglobales bacterium]
MSRLRVSAISFLNTAPLMWDFDHGDLRRRYEVAYTLPSACAEMLRQEMADIGIIPVAAYATIDDLAVIPGIAIAARGPVKSILLVSKAPIDKIKTVAADTSSRSSVALLQVLFRRFHGIAPEFKPMEPKLKTMLKECDAALLIGDPALLVATGEHQVYDLAEEWKRLTDKPFVFAFWAVRKQALKGDAKKVVRDFQNSRDHGIKPENLVKTAKEWTIRIGLTEGDILSYLHDNIHYHLDDDCLAGLKLFYQYAAEVGALPKTPEVEFC